MRDKGKRVAMLSITHVWTPPVLQAGIRFLLASSAVRSCVRPVERGTDDRWPRWYPLTTSQSQLLARSV